MIDPMAHEGYHEPTCAESTTGNRGGLIPQPSNWSKRAERETAAGERSMGTTVFDTHEFITNLINAGMPKQQAEVLATSQLRLMETTLVTKQDLKQELKDLEATITSKINDKIDSKIEKLDSKIERAIVVIISIVAAIATLTTIIIAFLT